MMAQQTVLLADDESTILSELATALEQAGYTVITAIQGDLALALLRARGDIDLAALDIRMPGMQGDEVRERLRAEHITIPIIFISQYRDDAYYGPGALEGLDEYLIKPFQPQELVARIATILELRNSTLKDQPQARLASHDLVVDLKTQTTSFHGCPLSLTSREAAVLTFLMKRSGTTISTHRLIDNIWGADYATDAQTVSFCITRLRRKLADRTEPPRYIEKVQDEGYRFVGKVQVLS